MPLQQGEPPELVSTIERVLSTWAGEKPWAEAQATLNA